MVAVRMSSQQVKADVWPRAPCFFFLPFTFFYPPTYHDVILLIVRPLYSAPGEQERKFSQADVLLFTKILVVIDTIGER